MKITVHLCGGLGNQMFQYAFGRSLAEQTGGELLLDTGRFEGNFRSFALEPYSLMRDVRLSSEADLGIALRIKIVKRLRKMGWKRDEALFGNLLMEPFPPRYVEIDLPEPKGKKNLFLEGMWQSERYFRRHRDRLLRDFTLEKTSQEASAWSGRIADIASSSVALHIRRGDYVTDPSAHRVHGLLPLDYYIAADRLLRATVADPVYFVFTDDVEWAGANLRLPASMHFVSGTGCSDSEEIDLMSRCSHVITANSSFSWWGAWLTRNPSRIAIAPGSWFRSMESDHIVPEDWIRI